MCLPLGERTGKSYLDGSEVVEQKQDLVSMGWLCSDRLATEVAQMTTRSRFEVQAQRMEGLKSRQAAVVRRKTKRVIDQTDQAEDSCTPATSVAGHTRGVKGRFERTLIVCDLDTQHWQARYLLRGPLVGVFSLDA